MSKRVSKAMMKMRRRHQRAAQKRARLAAKKNPAPPRIVKTRAPNNDDLWASIRGLKMFSMSIDELIELYNQHKANPLFASKVIAEAAKQVAITKGAKFVPKR